MSGVPTNITRHVEETTANSKEKKSTETVPEKGPNDSYTRQRL